MLNEDAYRQFLRALRDPEQLNDFREHPLGTEPVPVDLLTVGPFGGQAWEVRELAPAELLRRWHERPSLVLAFSLRIRMALAIMRSCVVRCENGTTQEATCSETSQDMANCFAATTLQCGPDGAAGDVKWTGRAPARDAVRLPVPTTARTFTTS
jgi:hypothetical protein